MREISQAVDLSGTISVAPQLMALERKGLLYRMRPLVLRDARLRSGRAVPRRTALSPAASPLAR
jgi:hypothetical protein